MKKNDTIKIICFKHNKTVHRVWDNCVVIDDNPDFLVIAAHKAAVYEDDGRKWQPTDPCFYVFLKNEWYNIIVTMKDDGINYYVNLASPYKIQEDNSICYIDYDLDVSLKVNQPIKILDEKEYVHHYKTMGYSLKLDYILTKTLYEILDKLKKKEYPFIDSKFTEYNKLYLKEVKQDGNKNN